MVDDETEATAVPALTIEDIFELLKRTSLSFCT
jgi:hypothetical protein